jgi:hypothetical protein
MGENYEGGFDLAAYASTFIVNTLMRVVGFLTKIVVLLIGLVSYILVLVFSFFLSVIWIFAPAIILGCIVLSATFFVV